MLLISEYFIAFPEFRVNILKCQSILAVKHLTLLYLHYCIKGLILSLAISKHLNTKHPQIPLFLVEMLH